MKLATESLLSIKPVGIHDGNAHHENNESPDARHGRIYNDPNLRKSLRLRKESEIKKDEIDLEQAMSIIGVGYAQILIGIIMCYLYMIPAVMPNMLDHFLLKTACNFEMDMERKTLYNFLVYGCEQVGFLVWAVISDKCSRKWTLFASLVTVAFGTAFIGFVKNHEHVFWVLMVGKSIEAFASPGIIIGVVAFYAEYINRYFRGCMLVNLEIGAVVGAVVFPLACYSLRDGARKEVYLAVVGAILVLFIPESPRYLLQKEDQAGAKKVLHRLQHLNSENLEFNFHDVKQITDKHDEYKNKYVPMAEHRPKYTIVVLIISQYIMNVSYVAVSFLMQEIGFKTETYYLQYSDKIRDSCHVNMGANPALAYIINDMADPESEKEFSMLHDCAKYNYIDERYVYYRRLLVGMSPMTVILWMMLYIDVVGRKIFVQLSHVFMGCVILTSYFINSNNMVTILSGCLYDSLFTMASSATTIIAVEMSSTKWRALYLATIHVCSKLAMVTVYLLFRFWNTEEENRDVYCVTMIACFSFLLACSGLLLGILPETIGVSLK